MMFLIVAICLVIVGTVAADWLHAYHLYKRGRTPSWGWMLWCTLTDALPFIVWLVGKLLPDNTTPVMQVMMWLIWAWILIISTRMLFYLFNHWGYRRVGWVVALAFGALLLWGATRGRTTLRINQIEIVSNKIPQGFDGGRFAQITDLHLGTQVAPTWELAQLVDSLNAQAPEALFFTGDLVNIRPSELDARAVRLLKGIKAPVFSVIGNHDTGAYIHDTLTLPREVALSEVIKRQQEMGWRVLDDQSEWLYRRGDSISLSGLSFDPSLRFNQHDHALEHANLEAVYRDIPDSVFNITLVHIPQLWEQIRSAGYGDLTLAGHTHAMQLRINLFGWSWSPAAWLYERWSGRHEEEGSVLYINDGVGCVGYPMRLGASPEITIFTLRRCE